MSQTILFVHGAWVTPACWDGFRTLYESKGYTCVVPPWPYMDRPVRALREQPDVRLTHITIKDLVDHFEAHIKQLPEPPVLIGHSFGGLIVQMLLDRGLGAAGVAIDSAPPRGVLPSLTATRSALPVLLARRAWSRILTMSFESFADTFANTLPQSQMRAAYDRHIVPAPGHIYFQAALGIGNAVTFANPSRRPLLLVTATKDRTSTTSMVHAMHARHRRAPAPTEMREFPNRSHWLIAEPGWEEVAREILTWASCYLSSPMPRIAGLSTPGWSRNRLPPQQIPQQ